MFELYFGEVTTLDAYLAMFTGITGGIVLAVAYRLSARGVPRWKPRKLVHVSMGTIIAFTVMWYSNLSGPALAAGIFLTILIYAWAHKSTLITELLVAGSREGETSRNTFASGFMGMVSFAIVFLFFFERPEIIVAAILSVVWGDAAGELVGRPLGGKFIRKPRANKSVEGAMGVFVFSTVSLLMSLTLHSVDTCPFCVIPQLLFIALVISIIETFSIGWTDNFLIPLITSILMWQLLFPGMTLFPIVA